MSEITIGIIGGGAAGMMAAITAARQGAAVTVLEGNARLGKKLLSTGNGKCNLGNRKLDVTEYCCREPERLGVFLNQFGTDEVISFFQGLGVVLKEKNGYLYPACEQASTVQDALRYEMRELGVRQITDCKISSVERNGQTGKIQVSGSGGSFVFDRVIVACGGKAAPKTGSDGSGFGLAEQLGHSVTPPVPALVPIRCREDYLKSVAGVRAEAQISVYSGSDCVAVERGELQITDYGLSGIPVFQVSREINYILYNRKEVEIQVDFLPDYSPAAYEQLRISRSLLLQDGRTVEEYFTGMLHKKLMMLFIRLAGLKPGDSIREADQELVKKVYGFCRQWRLHVAGSHSYDNAQVCAGGVPLAEVTDQMESTKTPGVYFAGEILDVDGRCGGYNLHWAWCSGYLAAMAAARER